MNDYAELITLTRKHLGIQQITILVHEEKPAEFELLKRLAQALSEKVGPTRVVFDSSAIGLPDLLIVTENSAQQTGLECPTYCIENLDLYLREPEKKRDLWNEIVSRL